jgi:hypothetical protein
MLRRWFSCGGIRPRDKNVRRGFVEGLVSGLLLLWTGGFTRGRERAYTSNVTHLRRAGLPIAMMLCVCLIAAATGARAQQPASKPASPPAPAAPATQEPAKKEPKEKTPHRPQLPFQIQLLETHFRFEANGDSRKIVHTVVRINNILGVQQFGRISFDYNRDFQQVEIPLVRVSHANGGTSELLPSAVTDQPNPAVEHFTVYHSVRVKSVRILGLQEGDTVEYRVITTTIHHPLAPDFWLEHTFDRSGQVLEEHYELDLPATRHVEPLINSATPTEEKTSATSDLGSYDVYKWKRTFTPPKESATGEEAAPETPSEPDVSVTTFTWGKLSARLAELLLPGAKPLEAIKPGEEAAKELARRPEAVAELRQKAMELTKNAKSDLEKLQALYNFVATQVSTVDVPLGSTGFRGRPALEILGSGYATAEDKYVLFAALTAAAGFRADAVLTGFCDKKAPAIPTVFKHLVIIGSTKDKEYWLDPAVEVAPFGMIPPTEAKCALQLRRDATAESVSGQEWITIPATLPFKAFQRVSVDATISAEGQLTAKVKYTLRGENELLLRVAFHQAPKDKWKDIATLLALSDGFRGEISSAKASDPLSTEEPFTVEYELTQMKFVDWSKKPVRIPALLPQIGLPDLPAPIADGKMAPRIELGTPLDVQTSMSLLLPDGTTVQTPAGTSVARDYATYTSKYSATQNTAVASRTINFLKREIPSDRAVDYTTFLQSVQIDQAQRLILIPLASLQAEPKAPAAKVPAAAKP